jgi:hypothetical protein
MRGRVTGIDREVGSARFPYAEDGDDRVHGSVKADTDGSTGPDACFAQAPGEPVRQAVEFGPRQLLGPARERYARVLPRAARRAS